MTSCKQQLFLHLTLWIPSTRLSTRYDEGIPINPALSISFILFDGATIFLLFSLATFLIYFSIGNKKKSKKFVGQIKF